MRTLTANTTTQKNAASTTPINVVKIVFGGAVGTKWYADRDLGSGDASSYDNSEGRLISWGRLSAPLR